MLVLKSIVFSAMRGMTYPYWMEKEDFEQTAALFALEAMRKIDPTFDEAQAATYCIQMARWRLIDFIRGERKASGVMDSRDKIDKRDAAGLDRSPQSRQRLMSRSLGRTKGKGSGSLGGDGTEEMHCDIAIDHETPEDLVVAQDEIRALREALREAAEAMPKSERRVVEMRLLLPDGVREGSVSMAEACAARRARKKLETALAPLGYTAEQAHALLDVRRSA